MSENLVEYTEQEAITRYIIAIEHKRILEANQTIAKWRERCEHRHVNIEHKRIDSYPPEFYSNMRCLVCGKRWTEEGSK
jgi:hypothetical protein